MSDYGETGRDRLDAISEALGRRYSDPRAPGRETRTRSELLQMEGLSSEVFSPGYPDMWDEEDAGSEEETIAALTGPSEVIIIDQAYPFSAVKRKPKSEAGKAYARPDLVREAYGQGKSNKSTRVWGMQWIPTATKTTGAGGDEDNLLTGDILVAFARPSNVQASSLYVYMSNPWHSWTAFRGATSLGRAIRLLSGARPYEPGDGVRYQALYPRVPDGDWIFGPSYMSMWSTTRPTSAAGTTLSVERFKEIFGE